jgi:hypothetical protein
MLYYDITYYTHCKSAFFQRETIHSADAEGRASFKKSFLQEELPSGRASFRKSFLQEELPSASVL